MADLPYLPLFVDDYEAATAHLSIEEDGAYTRLLRLCWRTPGCIIPDDPQWIARRMRVDLATFHRLVRPLLKEFFTLGGGAWVSPAIAKWKRKRIASERRPYLPLSIKAAVMERDNRTCVYCGDAEGPHEVDHIFPVILGGSDDLDNLACACRSCNRSKGALTLSEWGWHNG